MTPPKTLLLVEDEGLVRHDLKEGLVEAGFDVTDAAQSGKALSELEADPVSRSQRPSSSRQYPRCWSRPTRIKPERGRNSPSRLSQRRRPQFVGPTGQILPFTSPASQQPPLSPSRR